MKNINKLNPDQITQLIFDGLTALIKGFENIGFRKNTREEIKLLKEQVALLSKKVIELEERL